MSSKEVNDDVSSPGFTLTSNTLFSTRSKDIFASLDVLEKKHSTFQKTQEASPESLEHAGVIKCDPVQEDEAAFQGRNRNTDSNSKFRHRHDVGRSHDHRPEHPESKRNFREGGFRRPGPYRAKRVPDFKKHPDRYTCYSLEDVSESDMSDKSTKRAALDFIFERKNERERMERLAAGLPAEEEKFESDSAACSKGLISFSKSKSKREKKMDTDDEKSQSTGLDDRFVDGLDESVDEERNEGSIGKNGETMSGGSTDDKLDQKKEECKESMFKFKSKSRKNVKKHIRTRNDSDDET